MRVLATVLEWMVIGIGGFTVLMILYTAMVNDPCI